MNMVKGPMELERPSNGKPASHEALGKYRQYALAMIVVTFIESILLIPGVGEDREFPLSQLPTLLLSLWYFVAQGILLGAFVFIYKGRARGYYFGILLSAIVFGTNIPDVLGLLPPSAPTPRTMILLLATFPPAFLLAYSSWRALQFRIGKS